MKRLLFFPAVLWVSLCFSQRQNVYFLKNNGKYVDQRDSADYIRIVREPDSASVLYNVAEFYLNGKQKRIGKSKTIDPPRFEGVCVEYYASGNKESVTNYKNGLKAGLVYAYYTNGKPYLVTEYPAGGTPDGYFGDYLIRANYDSLGAALVENGNGYGKIYDNSFKYIAEEGNVKDGKRDGTWKGTSKGLKLSFKEEYKDGQLISGMGVCDDGTTTSYSKSRGTRPKFRGGYSAFSRYLGNNITYPDHERENNIQGRVILAFVVEKDGTVTEVRVNKSVSPALDAEAVRVISNSPRWIPATLYGKPVRVSYMVPVNFSLTN
jgi:TonB family protein